MKNGTLRNIAHIIIGFTLIYLFVKNTDFRDYSKIEQLVAAITMTLVSFIIGYIIEWIYLAFLEIVPSFWDCARTALGGLVAVILFLTTGTNADVIACSIAVSSCIIILETARLTLLYWVDIKGFFKGLFSKQ